MSTLRATLATRSTAKPEPLAITLDGREIGTVEIGNYSQRWHASFTTGKRGNGVHALVQGFGETPEEAIANGFVRTRAELRNALSLIDALEAAMYAEAE